MSETRTGKQIVSDRMVAYQERFAIDNLHAKIILTDLAKFCRANASTFHVEQRASDALVGRREVWLRIQQHLNLSEQQLWQLYGARD